PGEDHLGVFDGAFAVGRVVRPLTRPQEPEHQRGEFLTRLRGDAPLPGLPVEPPPGRPRAQPDGGKGRRPPREGERGHGPPEAGRAWIYGKWRTVRWKEVVCVWRVAGPQVKVKAVVAKVEGYKKRFTLVSSARDLTGLQLVEIFCARFRQEDGFRDLKQRLGWEECRAWTKKPIVRTTQMPLLAMTVLRLLPFRL